MPLYPCGKLATTFAFGYSWARPSSKQQAAGSMEQGAWSRQQAAGSREQAGLYIANPEPSTQQPAAQHPAASSQQKAKGGKCEKP